MFDGVRTHEEIAEHFPAETGTPLLVMTSRSWRAICRREPAPLQNADGAEHHPAAGAAGVRGKKRKRFVVKDFSDITIKTWYSADKYISWLYPKLRFLFTPWFVWTSVAMFVVMGWMWAERLAEIWSDSFAFYNFTTKSGSDLLEFWFLFGAMAAIHDRTRTLSANTSVPASKRWASACFTSLPASSATRPRYGSWVENGPVSQPPLRESGWTW